MSGSTAARKFFTKITRRKFFISHRKFLLIQLREQDLVASVKLFHTFCSHFTLAWQEIYILGLCFKEEKYFIQACILTLIAFHLSSECVLII
jgi:hypothetical protein